MGLIIILILVGIVLLVAELVLLPGISVAGIAAFISFAGAAFYGFLHFGVLGGSIVVASIVVLSILAVVISLRANTWKKLSLKTTIESTSTPTPQQQNIRIGQQGETITRLAPMGKVRFGEVTVEAKTIDTYLDPHQIVEVIGYDNTATIVKKVGGPNPVSPNYSDKRRESNASPLEFLSGESKTVRSDERHESL